MAEDWRDCVGQMLHGRTVRLRSVYSLSPPCALLTDRPHLRTVGKLREILKLVKVRLGDVWRLGDVLSMGEVLRVREIFGCESTRHFSTIERERRSIERGEFELWRVPDAGALYIVS